jgi:hypothetical protein
MASTIHHNMSRASRGWELFQALRDQAICEPLATVSSQVANTDSAVSGAKLHAHPSQDWVEVGWKPASARAISLNDLALTDCDHTTLPPQQLEILFPSANEPAAASSVGCGPTSIDYLSISQAVKVGLVGQAREAVDWPPVPVP